MSGFKPIKKLKVEIPADAINNLDRCWSPSFVRLDSKDNPIGLNWEAIFRKTRDINEIKTIYSAHGMNNESIFKDVYMEMLSEDHDSVVGYAKFLRDINVELPPLARMLSRYHKNYDKFSSFIVPYTETDMTDDMFNGLKILINKAINQMNISSYCQDLINICQEYGRYDELEKYLEDMI